MNKKWYKSLGLLALQVSCYHIWREINTRRHDKGSFNPRKLLDGIIVDIRTKISNSTWLQKIDCIGIFCLWID